VADSGEGQFSQRRAFCAGLGSAHRNKCRPVALQKGEKMRKISMAFSVAIVLAVPCAAVAVLGTVETAFDDYGVGGYAKVWGGGLTGVWTYSGLRILQKSGGTGQGELWADGPIAAFCIELNQRVSKNTLVYDVIMPENAPTPQTSLGGPMGALKAGYIGELWQAHFEPEWLGAGDGYSPEAEAFQIAIWEIVYEDIPEISAPEWDVEVDGTDGPLGFRCKYAATTLANEWLGELTGQGTQAQLLALVHPCRQDFVSEVPEPTVIMLLGLGTVILLRKRKA